MNTWGIYQKKIERDPTENPFGKYEKPKRINRPYEYRVEIAVLVGRPLPQIFGETKGFTERQLKGIIDDAKNDAIKFKINVGARASNLIKEVKLKNKTNGNINRPSNKIK